MAWRRENDFNSDKNKQAAEIYFTNRRTMNNVPRLFVNGNTVNIVHAHKQLRLVLDENLNFGNHINKMSVIKALYYILPRNSPSQYLHIIYQTTSGLLRYRL